MADRMLFISWGETVRGREEHALEVFNDAVGLYGRMQQEGRIDNFEVCLLPPHGEGLDGFMMLRGTHAQLDAVSESDDFQRMLFSANLIVENLRSVEGYTGEGIATQMTMYQESLRQLPHAAMA